MTRFGLDQDDNTTPVVKNSHEIADDQNFHTEMRNHFDKIASSYNKSELDEAISKDGVPGANRYEENVNKTSSYNKTGLTRDSIANDDPSVASHTNPRY